MGPARWTARSTRALLRWRRCSLLGPAATLAALALFLALPAACGTPYAASERDGGRDAAPVDAGVTVDAAVFDAPDPGDPEAGPPPMPGPVPAGNRYAFVTSLPIGPRLGDGSIADQFCNDTASHVGFLKGRSFLAFVATGPGGAFPALLPGAPWMMPSGEVVTSMPPTPTTRLERPLVQNEIGNNVLPGAVVWTGYGFAARCVSWTSTSSSDQAMVGSPFDAAHWLDAGTRTCDQLARLYCFEK